MPDVVLPLIVRELTAEDVPPGFAGWSETHRQSTLTALDRAKAGEVDLLCVCPPSGIPVATGGVDYAKPSGIPVIWQLSVDAALHSCGIGTLLIQALEQRIRDRGLTAAELGIDENSPRPRALYERLGYTVTHREPGAWNQEAPDGTVTRYETTITVLRKDLAPPIASEGPTEVSGWVWSGHVRTALEWISRWVGYDFDDTDWQAVEDALPRTSWEPPEQWYDYPIIGTPTLTVYFAREPGADPVGIRIQGTLDPILTTRLETLLALLADVSPPTRSTHSWCATATSVCRIR